jgi:hypothetical protein
MAVRKGWLVTLHLRNIVDYQQGGDDNVGTQFEEQRRSELANKHVELLSI